MSDNKEQVKKKYSEISKRYSLPDFEKMNKEFELEAINVKKSGIFLNALIRIFHSRLQQFLGYLDQFLMPQPSSAFTMFVFKGMSSEMRKDILKLYKKIAVLYQQSLKVILDEDDEKIKFINDVWNDYINIKCDFIKIVDGVKDVFLKEEKKLESLGYMG